MPTSRATRVTSSAKDDSWSTIVLRVSASAATSPSASTVIRCDRSPSATAVATCAMLRTWSVRLTAIELTESVRSRQVPETPLTVAWPPSLPSVPTSRATRVTSSAKDDSWSTIVLTVFFSSRISPCASTVIFCDRSPCATAVVTCAMLRTWPVRLPAIELTDSVRSRHTPDAPRTCAWPPSLPSVPTSRATRVTSSAKDDSWSTIVLTVVPIRRNSPLTGCPAMSSASCWDRSPSATAAMTRATSVVGRTRSSIRLLTAAAPADQSPSVPTSSRRSVMRPSRPMTWLARTSSRLRRSCIAASWLTRSASWPATPTPGWARAEKSPATSAVSTARTSARSAGGWPPELAG